MSSKKKELIFNATRSIFLKYFGPYQVMAASKEALIIFYKAVFLTQ
tara:strand:+ start:635 stop:772 length:138 start_codon:yes stop_codon:yes gene_type:complete